MRQFNTKYSFNVFLLSSFYFDQTPYFQRLHEINYMFLLMFYNCLVRHFIVLTKKTEVNREINFKCTQPISSHCSILDALKRENVGVPRSNNIEQRLEMLRSKEMLVKYYFYLIDLKKCAALTYAPFTLREDPIGVFMESDNYQPQLILKDITSNIDDVQRFIGRKCRI